jgi:hypothetical protein
MVRRRITIDSIGTALSVMPFARLVEGMGLSAKVMPAPARPFCFAGGPSLNAVRSIERYTDEGTGNQLKGLHEFI